MQAPSGRREEPSAARFQPCPMSTDTSRITRRRCCSKLDIYPVGSENPLGVVSYHRSSACRCKDFKLDFLSVSSMIILGPADLIFKLYKTLMDLASIKYNPVFLIVPRRSNCNYMSQHQQQPVSLQFYSTRCFHLPMPIFQPSHRQSLYPRTPSN